MAEPAIPPERRLLGAVFPDEFFLEPLGELLEGNSAATLEELRRQIDAALDTLSYRERGILEMRYGLGDGHIYTLAESGYVFGLTRERIRQLQARSLERLRQRAGGFRESLSALILREGRGGAPRNCK